MKVHANSPLKTAALVDLPRRLSDPKAARESKSVGPPIHGSASSASSAIVEQNRRQAARRAHIDAYSLGFGWDSVHVLRGTRGVSEERCKRHRNGEG
jgi:hypothetical protein